MSERTVEVLQAARELISKPEAWTKGASLRYAKNLAGPCQFCASGAIYYASHYDFVVTNEATNALRAVLPRRQLVPRWNDARRRTHAEVLAAFDAAIRAQRGTARRERPRP